MDKFQLMALMMGGGGGAEPAAQLEGQLDLASALEATVAAEVAVQAFAETDLSVELGLAKVGQIVPVVIGYSTTAPDPYPLSTNVRGGLKPDPDLKAAIKNLQEPNAQCRFCYKQGLLWLMNDEGKWRIHEKDGTVHICERPIPFTPVVAIP